MQQGHEIMAKTNLLKTNDVTFLDLIGNGKKHLVPSFQPAGTALRNKELSSKKAVPESRAGKNPAHKRQELTGQRRQSR